MLLRDGWPHDDPESLGPKGRANIRRTGDELNRLEETLTSSPSCVSSASIST